MWRVFEFRFFTGLRPSVALGRHEGQILFGDARIAAQEELVEDLAAGSPLLRRRHILDKPVLGKFICEDEGASGDPLFDLLELIARALEVRFGGAALQRWTVANAVELEIELDAFASEGTHATLYGFSAHCRSVFFERLTLTPGNKVRPDPGFSPALHWMRCASRLKL